MKTESLKASIYSRLSRYGTVYEDGRLPDSPANPYCVYALSSSTQGLGDDAYCRQINLSVDMYYRSTTKNTSSLEALSDSIENGIAADPHKNEQGFSYDFTAPIKNEEMPTTDEFMFRRRLTYTLRYFESEE